MSKFPHPRHHFLLALQTFFNARIRALSFSVLLTVSSLLKLWLDSSLRIAAETSQNYDDALYVRLSYHISHGDWLGPYNSLTLIKYPLYPLWLAFNYKTGLPLLLTQSIFNILAGLLLVYQLRRCRMNYSFLLATFLFYLFNPFIETRVMREGIYSGLTVLVFACFIGVYRHVFSSKLRHVLWSVLLGFSLGFFWLTREEGIWIVPAIISLSIYLLASLYDRLGFSKQFCLRLMITSISLFILFLLLNAVSLINYHHYGVYRLCDQNSRPFTTAVGSLLRIKHTTPKLHLLLPRDTRERLYLVSAAFRELQPYIDGYQGLQEQRERWKEDTCRMFPQICFDYGGAWFYWVLRLAVSDAGYYVSAQSADSYYERLSNEIDNACEKKLLDCSHKHDATVPPYREGYAPLLAKTYAAAFMYILRVPVRDYVYNPYAFSNADLDGLQAFHMITHNRTLPIMGVRSGRYSLLKRNDLMKLSGLKFISRLYQTIFPSIVFLTLALYVFCLLFTLWTMRFSFLFVLSTSILIALAFRLLILSYIDLTLFPAFTVWPGYISPFYPLYLIFAGLIFTDFFNKISGYLTALGSTV